MQGLERKPITTNQNKQNQTKPKPRKRKKKKPKLKQKELPPTPQQNLETESCIYCETLARTHVSLKNL